MLKTSLKIQRFPENSLREERSRSTEIARMPVGEAYVKLSQRKMTGRSSPVIGNPELVNAGARGSGTSKTSEGATSETTIGTVPVKSVHQPRAHQDKTVEDKEINGIEKSIMAKVDFLTLYFL